MPFSADSTIRDLIADDRAKAIIERYLPGASHHPRLPEALFMSLREVSYYPESGLNQSTLAQIDRELQALG